MSQHHDPVQASLILNGFSSDEVLFGVAQKRSLKCIQKSAAEEASGGCEQVITADQMLSGARPGQFKSELVALTGIEPVF
jgi:hypothetical protein